MDSEDQYSKIKVLYAELEKDPGSPVFAALADLYREEGLLDEAFSVCQRGLSIHPNYAEAHVVLGQIHAARGSLEEAESELEVATRLDPNDAWAFSVLGQIYAHRNKNQAAINCLDRAHFLNPEDSQITDLMKEIQEKLSSKPNSEGDQSTGEQSKGSLESPFPYEKALEKLRSLTNYNGVKAILLIDKEGNSHTLDKPGWPEDRKLGQNILKLKEVCAITVKETFGDLKRVILEGNRGSLIIEQCKEFFVIAAIDNGMPIGPVSLSIDQFVKQED